MLRPETMIWLIRVLINVKTRNNSLANSNKQLYQPYIKNNFLVNYINLSPAMA